MDANGWTGSRALVALADAFDGLDPNAGASSFPAARGSRLASACLILLLALPVSAVPRYFGVGSMGLSLLIAFVTLAALIVLSWPLLGVRPGGWRMIGWVGVATMVASGLAWALLRAAPFEGFPAASGGDSGNHLWFQRRFVSVEPTIYDGMVTLYALGHWSALLRGGDELVGYVTVFQITIIALMALTMTAFVLALRIEPAQARQRAPLAMLGLGAMGVVAFFVTLPLIHYYQTDGFLAQVFFLAPLCLTVAGYTVASRRLVRLLVVGVGLVLFRFTYVLNVGDLTLAFALVLLAELRAAPQRRLVRSTLIVVALGLLGISVISYTRIFPLAVMPGGFLAAPLLPQLLGLAALSLLFAVASPVCARFGVALPEPLRRLAVLLAVFCGMPTLLVSGWLLTGHEPTYYVRKYTFLGIVLGSLCLVPIVVSVTTTLGFKVRTRAALFCALGFVGVATAGVYALAQSVRIYVPSFYERFVHSREPRLAPHSDRKLWNFIDTTLKRENATFGGFLTPRWAESQFTNAHYSPMSTDDFRSRFVDTPGHCVFWYGSWRLSPELQNRWFDGARERVSRLESSKRNVCRSFRPRHAPRQRFAMCSRCFHGRSRILPFGGDLAATGFHGVERLGDGTEARWTNGNGRVDFTITPEEEALACAVRVEITNSLPFELWLDGQRLGPGLQQPLPAITAGVRHQLEIRARSFVPAADGSSEDERQLGVQVRKVTLECSDDDRPTAQDDSTPQE